MGGGEICVLYEQKRGDKCLSCMAVLQTPGLGVIDSVITRVFPTVSDKGCCLCLNCKRLRKTRNLYPG